MKESIEKFDNILMRDARAFIEFQSKDEYLVAMVEDLSDWLNYLYGLKDENRLDANNFFGHLKNGVILCKHANLVQSLAEEYLKSSTITNRQLPMKIGNQIVQVPLQPPTYTVVDFTKTIFYYHGRDNVSNFICWCRNFHIPASLTFETDDLVNLKNPRSVVVALLELSKIGRLFGMEVPDIVQMDQEIEDEILRNNNNNTEEEGIDVEDTSEKYKVLESMDRSLKENEQQQLEQCIQVNNSSSSNMESKKSPRKSGSFGLKDRRMSANLTRHDVSPQCSYGLFLSNGSSCPSDKEDDRQLPITTNSKSSNAVIRKSQSFYFDAEDSPGVSRVDNSDNESNFSQSSHSNFLIPKYKTARPVGRVKIYDNFDKSNYVKERKTREKVDLRSLDERVREVLSLCTCNELFLMKRISEGRYQFGDKKTLIFVRILRLHVMVRVGGGWDTLGNFLTKHDPCRKGKIDDFKFFLPTQSRRAQPITDESYVTLQPNETCPGNGLNFSQGMVSLKDLTKSKSSDSFDGREHRRLTEETDENMSVSRKLAEFTNEKMDHIVDNKKPAPSAEEHKLACSLKEHRSASLIHAFKRHNNNNLALPNKNLITPHKYVVMRTSPPQLDVKMERSQSELSPVTPRHKPDVLTPGNHESRHSSISDNASAVTKASTSSSSKIPRFQFQKKK